MRHVYRIFDRETGEAVGSYERGNYDKYDFESVDDARSANCHGMFKDTKRYAIAKYRITEQLIDKDVP